MKHFQKLPKLSPGDQVAVISPSAGLPGLFPAVQDLGLTRMREVFDLHPIEYPTTRQMNSSLEDRARDVMAAFADLNNKAVFASTGGDNQIQLLKHLDPQVFIDNPKPFFGFSDNTHLHNFLWNLGIPSYYGGHVMGQFGMGGTMFDMTVDSLKHALFSEGEFVMNVSSQFADEDLDWSVEENLNKPRKLEPNEGLIWDGERDVEGILWGGCAESLIVQVAAAKYLPSDDDINGAILVLETAEDIPEHWIIEYLLTGFGERGWLDKFSAVLVGRPKAWSFSHPNSAEQKSIYKQTQRETVVKTIRRYNQTMPSVQNVDFGHTNPQIILPLGRKARVVASEQKVYLEY